MQDKDEELVVFQALTSRTALAAKITDNIVTDDGMHLEDIMWILYGMMSYAKVSNRVNIYYIIPNI